MTWDEAYEQYADTLNEIYGEVKLGDLSFDPASIIQQLDPIAYRVGFSDWADSEGIDTDELDGKGFGMVDHDS